MYEICKIPVSKIGLFRRFASIQADPLSKSYRGNGAGVRRGLYKVPRMLKSQQLPISRTIAVADEHRLPQQG